MQKPSVQLIHADVDQEDAIAGQFAALTHDVIIHFADGLPIHENVTAGDAVAELDAAAGELYHLSVFDDDHAFFRDAKLHCQRAMALQLAQLTMDRHEVFWLDHVEEQLLLFLCCMT